MYKCFLNLCYFMVANALLAKTSHQVKPTFQGWIEKLHS